MEEDLNIERNVFKIIECCWYNRKRFKTIEDIAMVTKASPKTIYRIARDNNLPYRYLINSNATNKEGAQIRTKVR